MTPSTTQTDLVRPLDQLTSDDTATVGGKNASLGEMIRELAERGVRVPGGFATTADAYRLFIAENELEQPIREALEKLDGSDKALRKVGAEVRELITGGELPGPLTEAIRTAYRGLATDGDKTTPVAARSSATAEDLPEASFAGQLETFLNLRGEDAVLDAVKRCFASLFTDRGIAYRQNKGFDHMKVALSVGVQRMVHTDRGGAGVMFTLDTETGFPDVVVILASPGAAMRWWNLPARGIGLARMEFIVNNDIQAHPLALTRFDEIEDRDTREKIEALTRGFDDKPAYFVEKLSRGIAKIAAAGYPHDVIVRLSDFKTNEYADLLGGSAFEPQEANPMIGFRGAARYVSDRYRDGFALECAAIHRAREVIGLGNIVVMVPFCRTPEEADAVLRAMADHGLVRGEHGLRVYVMAEIPSNIILADEFAQRFDGFSIGTNDLTQLVLGIDRDAEALAERFDEQHAAIKWSVRRLIERAHAAGKPVGICGQAPSDHPEFAEFLAGCGIDSISVNPDSVMDVLEHIAAAEAEHRPGA